MSEDELNLIRDMLRTPGWKLIEARNLESVQLYRHMATQAPECLSENMRTWYSGKAAGREEFAGTILELVGNIV